MSSRSRRRFTLKPEERTWANWTEECLRLRLSKPNRGRSKYRYIHQSDEGRRMEDWLAEFWQMKDELRKRGLYKKFRRCHAELINRGLKYQEAAFEAYQCCLHPGLFWFELTSAEVLERIAAADRHDAEREQERKELEREKKVKLWNKRKNVRRRSCRRVLLAIRALAKRELKMPVEVQGPVKEAHGGRRATIVAGDREFSVRWNAEEQQEVFEHLPQRIKEAISA